MKMKLTDIQKKNAFLLLDRMAKSMIHPDFWIAILCIIMKECALIPQREKSFSRTSLSRIRDKFSRARLGKYYDDDEALTNLKKDNTAFFNVIYGKRLGNTTYTDGWDFRGGGFPQHTGRGNYAWLKDKTGHDFIENPGLIADPEIAADCAVLYYEYQILESEKKITREYPVLAMAHLTAGINHSPASKVVRTAYRNAMKHLDDMTAIYREWDLARSPKLNEQIEVRNTTSDLVLHGTYVGRMPALHDEPHIAISRSGQLIAFREWRRAGDFKWRKL